MRIFVLEFETLKEIISALGAEIFQIKTNQTNIKIKDLMDLNGFVVFLRRKSNSKETGGALWAEISQIKTNQTNIKK